MTTITRKASQKQADLITRIAPEKEGGADLLAITLEAAGVDTVEDLDIRTASATIDRLFNLPRKQAGGTVKAEPGYYAVNGEPFVVVKAKNSDRLYAKRLVLTENEGGRTTARWEYEPGMVFRFTLENRITVEQAAAFGHLHGICMVCATPLTDPKSVARGIGPVCATRI